MKKIFYVLLILLIIQIKSSEHKIEFIKEIIQKYNNTEYEKESEDKEKNDTFYYNDILDLYNTFFIPKNKIDNEDIILRKKSEKILLENIIYLNEKEIFCNFPRGINESYPTFVKFENDTYKPWPNEGYNNKTFISIISFDFDNEDNIYILDEGNNNNSIILYKFNNKGEKLKQYKILVNKSTTLNIIDFVIDKINKYIYISYYNQTYNEKDEYEIGFLVKKLNNDDYKTKKVVLKDQKLKYDDKYDLESNLIKNHFPDVTKKYISMSLSCDGKVLFFSPLSSRMIFSVLTETIRNNDNISLKNVNEAYKNDASHTMIYGNLGNLYFNGIENNVTYIAGQIDNDLTIFDYKGIDTRENDKKMTFVTKMNIRDGFLYIICKDIEEDEEIYTVKTKIFRTEIDKEKSYVYKCAGLSHKWEWNSYVIWILFFLIVIFVLVFVFIENKEDKDINKNK